MEALHPGPPDYNNSALNHPATLQTFSGAFHLINCNHNGEFDQNCLKTSQTLGVTHPRHVRAGNPKISDYLFSKIGVLSFVQGSEQHGGDVVERIANHMNKFNGNTEMLL